MAPNVSNKWVECHLVNVITFVTYAECLKRAQWIWPLTDISRKMPIFGTRGRVGKGCASARLFGKILNILYDTCQYMLRDWRQMSIDIHGAPDTLKIWSHTNLEGDTGLLSHCICVYVYAYIHIYIYIYICPQSIVLFTYRVTW